MDEQLKAMFPWLGAQNIQYTPYKGLFVGAKEGEESPRLGFGFNVNNQEYVYVPQSILNKGVVTGNQQHYFPAVITPGFNEKLQQEGKFYTPEQITQLTGNNEFERDYKNSPYKNETGVLVPVSLLAQFPQNKEGKILRTYTMGPVEGGFIYGPIEGIYTNPNGQVTYKVQGGGKENPRAWINPDTLDPQGLYYEPGDKWYDTGLGKLGIGLIALGTGGLALGAAGGGAAAGGAAAGGTAAAGGAAAGGTAAGLGGAAGTGITAGTTATGIGGGALGTGLTAGTTASGIGGGALGTGLTAGAAGAGLTAGAAGGATAGTASTGLLDTAQFAQTGQTGLTPGAAGQGLQVPTTPGLSSMGGGTGLTVPVTGGTVTQLGFVPTGATPVLGDPASFINNPDVLGNTVFSTDYLAAPGAAAGLSASDALRLMNQARGLLGAGQNPIVPQQQGLPQQAGGSRGVDYSGLLSLLQLQAGLPGVAPLTAPAQLRQIYQPTLLPNVLSLLG